MNELFPFLTEIFHKGLLIRAIFCMPADNKKVEAHKIVVRPLSMQKKLLYQITEYVGSKALHFNLKSDECQNLMQKFFQRYRQALLYTSQADYHILTDTKGKMKYLNKPASMILKSLSHNRQKNYFLQEGKPIPFLVETGIMNEQGRIFPQKMNKFRQINRFLEIVNDILPYLNHKKHVNVVDFGCGKAYLTFALRYFLTQTKGFSTKIVGVDCKQEMIEKSQQLAEKLGFDNLQFIVGDIANYCHTEHVDLVVSLHACDTATDSVLKKAVNWKSDVILCAPCCQHEVLEQVSSHSLRAFLEYGILKERFSAIVTDAARAQILEINGYRTQILEFIESEHTAKNLMIRAVRGNKEKKRILALKSYQELKTALNITLSLEQILFSAKED